MLIGETEDFGGNEIRPYLKDTELTLGRTNSFEKSPRLPLQLAFFFFEFRRNAAKVLEHSSVGEDGFCDQFSRVSAIAAVTLDFRKAQESQGEVDF